MTTAGSRPGPGAEANDQDEEARSAVATSFRSVVDTLKWRYTQAFREVIHDARSISRRPTASRRMLPSFMIIGGQRCGTTSMYRYLSEHPDIVEPLGKELHYFTYEYTKSTVWYQSHFPLHTNSTKQTFEATPYYLFHPAAAVRVHGLLPAARLVVLLRNPVDRAFSHYQHNRGLGLEPLSFEEALAAEETRLAGENERLMEDPAYPGLAHRRYSYFSRGCYTEQITEWYRVFPREQILVLFSEDFYRNTAKVFGEVLDFLGLKPFDLGSYPRYTRRATWHEPPLAEKTRRELAERYTVPNQRLAQLMGRDPGWND
jgi:hypothetical protein